MRADDHPGWITVDAAVIESANDAPIEDAQQFAVARGKPERSTPKTGYRGSALHQFQEGLLWWTAIQQDKTTG